MVRRFFLYIFFFLSAVLFSTQSFSNGVNEQFISVSQLSLVQNTYGTSFSLLLSIVCSVIVILAALLFFIIKLLKVNRQLQERNRQINDINVGLQRVNSELSDQKSLIKKEQNQVERFFRKMVRSADVGICFTNKDWSLKYANSAFYSLFGIEEGTFSESVFRKCCPDYPDLRSKIDMSLSSSGFFESEIKIRNNGNNILIVVIRSTIIKDETEELSGILTTLRDITKLKKAHEDIIKANAEVETSKKLKASFLANISHEIRTPLNSVVGFSNLLLSNDITIEMKEEYVEQINHNSEKLLQIIGDIIDLSRLESSQIEITYEETSLNSVVNEVIEDVRQVIKRNEKPIILNVKNQFGDNGDLIFSDRIWLKRVLGHLMDNAVKFTLDGSIELLYFREEENVIFKIKDTGIGINKENLGHIFEEFRQEITGHHRPFEGLGIGLTLAKEVVERMGGKIFVQSEKGIGSEFSFSIPYRPAGSSKNKFKLSNDNQFTAVLDWSSKKCLLVDDNKDVLIYLSRILIDTGVSILTAKTGFEAIEIVKNTPDVDVILLDMQMPEMNGIDTAKEIRKIRKDIPVIAQTAFIFEDDRDIILEAGCDACLLKPIKKEHLLTVMSSFVKSN
ncbi:MAG TPA: response regulator [Bacteroidales bacterium]|nr:response regulator [Bacteroidales bacterium]